MTEPTTPLDIITAAQTLIAASEAVYHAQADLTDAQAAQRGASEAFAALKGDDITSALPANLTAQEAADVIRAISLIVPTFPTGPFAYQTGGQV
jgi:hypothetical protein